MNELITIKEASEFASSYLNKDVTTSNITYLLNYGRVVKVGDNGSTMVSKQSLIEYYETTQREIVWKKKLGADLNWDLSFDQYKESDTTKHVHRLHPYKGNLFRNWLNIF